MKASTLLRNAVNYLQDGSQKDACSSSKSGFVCFAVLRCHFDSDQQHKERQVYARVVGRIEELLDGCPTILTWLYTNKHITRRQFDVMDAAPSKKLQAYRRAWMEHLALEFEAKGD